MERGTKQRLSLPLMLAFRSVRSGAGIESLENGEPAALTLPKRRFAAKLAATERLVRDEVLTDLAMLVNSIALDATVDLTNHPHARSSIVNYGLPDFAARTIHEGEVATICAEIAAALRLYEPRLVPETIKVDRDTEVDSANLSLRFRVRADLLCTPVNVPVEFVADMEIDSRKIKIERQ